jgi:hypothetical protein
MAGAVLVRAGGGRQVTYRLLAGAGATRSPWAITTIVSCLPVLVLAMGTTLAHMLRHDALTAQAAADLGTGQPDCWSPAWSPGDQARTGPDQAAAEGPRGNWSHRTIQRSLTRGSPGNRSHHEPRSPG